MTSLDTCEDLLKPLPGGGDMGERDIVAGDRLT